MLSVRHFFKILFESRYVFLYTITERLFFFIVFLIFARNYSTEFYGQLIIVFTVSNITILFFDFGLPILLQKEISANKKHASEFLSISFFLSMFSFVFYFCIIYFYCYSFYSFLKPDLIILVILNVFSYFILNQLHSVLFALSEFKKQFTIFIIFKIIILIIFSYGILIQNLDINWELLILLIGNILNILILFYFCSKRNIKLSSGYILKDNVLDKLKMAIPLGLAVIFNFMYDKIDIIILSFFSNFSQVAFYNVGYGIYKASSLSFSFLLIPALTRVTYLGRKTSAVKLFLKKYSFFLVYISLVVGIILFFLSGIIINFLYTDKYIGSSLIIKILSFAIIGLALNNLTGTILNGLGLFKENLYVTLSGLIMNIILNVIFIPNFGIIVPAAVTIITEYYILMGDIIILNRYFKKTKINGNF